MGVTFLRVGALTTLASREYGSVVYGKEASLNLLNMCRARSETCDL